MSWNILLTFLIRSKFWILASFSILFILLIALQTFLKPSEIQLCDVNIIFCFSPNKSAYQFCMWVDWQQLENNFVWCLWWWQFFYQKQVLNPGKLFHTHYVTFGSSKRFWIHLKFNFTMNNILFCTFSANRDESTYILHGIWLTKIENICFFGVSYDHNFLSKASSWYWQTFRYLACHFWVRDFFFKTFSTLRRMSFLSPSAKHAYFSVQIDQNSKMFCFGVSYDHDFFTGNKVCVLASFQIPRLSLLDSWKVFWVI